MPRSRLPALVAAAFLLSTCGSEPTPPTVACRGPLLPGDALFENVEVEPFLAVDPTNPAHLADNISAGRGRFPDARQRKAMIEFFATL